MSWTVLEARASRPRSLGFAILALLACAAWPLSSNADTDPTAEYAKKIKSAQVVSTLGPDLVGDSTNLYTGATSFNVSDVSLPGNSGLAVAIGRNFEVSIGHWEASNPSGTFPMQRLFGDWDLDIPYMSGIYSNQYGWEIDSTTPQKRCSVLDQKRIGYQGQLVKAAGSPRGYPQPFMQWAPTEFWHGIDLHLPGGGSQSLLVADQTAVGKPGLGGPYHWTTKNDWWFSCLGATINGAAGEAFVARAPNGDTYRFEHMSERWVSQLWERICTMDGIPEPQGEFDGTCDHRRIARKEYMLLPTLVTDRFGNWVRYNWSADAFARLNSITSSDGRTITLHYNAKGLVEFVRDGTREWKYNYTYTSSAQWLREVVLPDQSTWQYALTGLPVEGSAQACVDIGETHHCYAPPVTSGQGIGYIIHPSGAKVQFTTAIHFKPTINGYGAGGGAYPLGLTSKAISGPGVTEATWTYSYWPDRTQFLAACGGVQANCPDAIYVDAKGPDNSITRSTFGIEPFTNQGLLLSEVRGTWNGASIVPLSTTTYSYANPSLPNGYVAKVGSLPQNTGDGLDNEYFYPERRLPVKVRTSSQQGATFVSNTTSFNPYAQPASVTRSSAGLAGPVTGYSRTEATSYRHDTAKWVIGQVASVTDVGSGLVVSQIDYDNATLLPIRSYKFGSLTQSMTYNAADGTLATITDGNGNVTKIGNWYRGVPRLITYPAVGGVTDTQSATVNNLGDLTAVINELGVETGYGYDGMGRLSRITYPSGDSVPWNPLGRGFTRVDAPEYGIPAGHWRQTVETGAGKATTFYDARWQPVLTLSEDTGIASSKSFVVRRFDAFGRETFSSYPVGSATVNSTLAGVVTQYDALGRPTTVKQDSELGTLTTTTDYLTGFQTRVTNPRGYPTTTSFQVFDDPGSASPTLIQAPQGVTTTIARDNFGDPLSITRSGPGG